MKSNHNQRTNRIEGSNATESLLDGFIAIGSQLEGSSASESQLDGFIAIRWGANWKVLMRQKVNKKVLL